MKSKIITTCVLLITCLFYSFGENYAPILVDGREWIYYVHHCDEEHYMSYKIIGDTVYNGKNAKKISRFIDYDYTKPDKSYYADEEEGKVYAFTGGEFRLALDLTLNRGEYVQSDSTLRVVYVDSVTVGDKIRKREVLVDDWRQIYFWIDGLGSSYYSFYLPDDPICWGYYDYLEEIRENGKTIFKREDFFNYPDELLQAIGYYSNMVKDHCIWEYQTTLFDKRKSYLFRIQMDSDDTKTIGNRVFKSFKIIYTSTLSCDWSVDAEGNPICTYVTLEENESPEGLPYMYLYETGMDIYGYLPLDQAFFRWHNPIKNTFDADAGLENGMFKLYDFTLNEGERYTSVAFSNTDIWKCEYVIDKKEIINIDEETKVRKIIRSLYNEETGEHLYPVEIIEGLGPLSNACISYFPYANATENPFSINYIYNDLKRVYGNGEVKYYNDTEDRYAQMLALLDTSVELPSAVIGEQLQLNSESIIITGGGTLNIFDTTGRLVLNRQVQSGDEVEVSALPSGTYIATLSTGATLKFHK